MSHFSVAVITKTNTEEEIDRLLLPYQEYGGWEDQKIYLKDYLKFYESEDCDEDEETHKCGYWQNPNAKWDWYQISRILFNNCRLPHLKNT